MSKILNFFLPKIPHIIIKHFLVFLALTFSLKIFPLSEYAEMFLTVLGIFLIFPICAYYNKGITLSKSLNWLLLTPVSKKDLVLANGIINITKILFIGILLFFYSMAMYGRSLDLKASWQVISTVLELGNMSTSTIASLLIFLAFFGTVLFGMIPDFSAGIINSQNRKQKITSKHIAVVFLILVIVIGGQESQAIPSSIQYTLIITAMFGGCFWSIFHVLNIYYRPVALVSSSSILGFLIFSFFYFNASVNISEAQSIKLAMNESTFLGALDPEARETILRKLRSEDPRLAKLDLQSVQDFFVNQEKGQAVQEIKTIWLDRCLTKKDYSCRLSYYLSMDVNQLKASCPNDLKSCEELVNNKRLPASERSEAHDLIVSSCNSANTPSSDFCCNCWKPRKD